MRNNKSLDLAIEEGCRLLLEQPKITKTVFSNSSYNDEPKLYHYNSYILDKYSQEGKEESSATGIAFDKKRSLIKLIGETIERHALGANDKSRYIKESYKNLGMVSLNPENLVYFLKKDIRLLKLSNQKINWIQGKSLNTDKKIYVPAQLIYVPYRNQKVEPTIQFPISSGAATSTTLEDAICRGTFELIERDSFMVHYLNRLNSPFIDIKSIKNKSVERILKTLKRYKLEIYIVDITTDMDIPSVASILIDKTGIGSAVSVGLRAGFNIIEIIISSIEEALMTRSWTRDEFSFSRKHYRRKRIIRTIEDRALFWFKKESIKYLDFWLKNIDRRKSINIKNYQSKIDNSFEKLIEIFRRKNEEIIYVDITQDYILKYGFKIAKVIAPGLQQLYLDEAYPYLGGKRLYNAPIVMGYYNKAKTRDQLNSIPHPIL